MIHIVGFSSHRNRLRSNSTQKSLYFPFLGHVNSHFTAVQYDCKFIHYMRFRARVTYIQRHKGRLLRTFKSQSVTNVPHPLIVNEILTGWSTQ